MPKSRKRKPKKNSGVPDRLPNEPTHAKPAPVSSLMEQGMVLFNQAKYEDAEYCFRQALSLDQENADAYNMIGAIGLSVGRPDLALEYFEAAASCNENSDIFWMNQSITLLQLGDVERATATAKQAVELNPGNADAWNTLGMAYKAQQDWGAAKEALTKSVGINPRHGEAWINLCGTLQELDLLEEALDAGEKSVANAPQFPESYYNLAGVKQALLLHDEAIALYEKCIDLNPHFFDAYVNLSRSLIALQRLREAEEAAQKAIALNPDSDQGYVNLGRSKCEQGRLSEGVAEFYKAVERNPSAPEAHTNLGFALLAQEEFSTGWDEYEYAFLSGSRGPFIKSPTPVWEGQPLDGKLIHIYGEQGIGDQIMYGSMLQEIIDQGAQVIFECERRLIPLFQRAFPDMSVIELTQPPDPGTRNPDEDYRISIGSLGKWIRRSVNDFKPCDQYLSADPDLTATYRKTYKNLGEGPTIGISWRSKSPNFSKNKSVPIDLWRPILETEGCQFVSLQYGDVEDDIRQAKEKFGVDIFVDPDVSAIDSLEQSAAQISAVDLVISISNATIHFAGACGVKTWMLLGPIPLWHWFLEREDSLWYKSVRCIRCKSEDDWENIVGRTADDLKTFIAGYGS